MHMLEPVQTSRIRLPYDFIYGARVEAPLLHREKGSG